MDLTKLKRFDADQHDQLKQLIAWCELMGLSGKDLVSLGGKIERLKEEQERSHNLEIIKGFGCLPIGSDVKRPKSRHEDCMDERFKLKTVYGAYNFQYNIGNWQITSLSTKAKKTVGTSSPYDYALSKSYSWRRRSRYTLLLDIHHGKIQLNF